MYPQLLRTIGARLRGRLSDHAQVIAGVAPETGRHRAEPYQLPLLGTELAMETPIGVLRIEAPRGRYYSGSALFVYFPEGYGYTEELAQAFLAGTNGEFHLDPAPGTSQGGDDSADAIVTAGLDYRAYMGGSQKGYFKFSSAPRLDQTAALLWTLIQRLYGSVPAST